MTDNNPYKICTWDKESDCISCSNHKKLNCKWNRRTLIGFHLHTIPYTLIAFFGLVVTGLLTKVWWPIATYVAFCVIFLGVVEVRVLCSHCPYYGERGRFLHCLANYGVPKLWRYRPWPLGRAEKVILVCLLLFYWLFPLLCQGYGIGVYIAYTRPYNIVTLLGLVGIASGTFLSGLTLYFTLCIFYCSCCVNFSCPLNAVPKREVDEYLRRNDVIRKAWEEKGYKLD